jgi:hypothetical protein
MTRSMLIAIIMIAVVPQFALAQQETSHYPPGAEGLKAASLPPPGTYLKWYNVAYNAHSLKDAKGKDVPVDLNLEVFATVPRLIWMTEEKFLGADYGMDVAVPFVNVDLRVASAGIDDSTFGLGDVLYEPVVLGWHFDRVDIGAAAGVWMPTGDFDPNSPVNAGKGFYTGMFTLGSTVYFDEEKIWHLSALGRYETNSQKQGIDIRPGDDFHIEWGLGKNLTPALTVGMTAYTHWQVTSDKGSAVTYDASVHDRFFSAGPEVLYFHEPAKMFFSARYQTEFGSVDRLQGHNLVVSCVKIF